MKYKKLGWAAAALWMLAAGMIFSCCRQDGGAIVDTLAVQETSKEKEPQTEQPQADSKAQQTEADGAEVLAAVVVHVCGQVRNPGVYEAAGGSRVYELIELAGGLTEEAAGEYLNLASAVEDGQQIYVPGKEEAASMTRPLQAGAETKAAKININTADIAQLTALRGIGEAKAQDIINYRESHGGFQKIEDIMKISGIKEAAFEKIKDQITVTE